MNIRLNNNPEFIEAESLTISDLLRVKNFTFKMLVVKLNGQVIRKDKYDETSIRDGDEVAVIHLVSGG